MRQILWEYDRETVFDFYYNLCYYFATSKGFDEQDLATLLCVQRAARLPNQTADRARYLAIATREKELSVANELNPVAGGGEAKEVILPSGGEDTQMDEQKYCGYCGAVNPTRAIFLCTVR